MAPFDLMNNPEYLQAYRQLHEIAREIKLFNPILAKKLENAKTSQDVMKILQEFAREISQIQKIEVRLTQIITAISKAEKNLRKVA